MNNACLNLHVPFDVGCAERVNLVSAHSEMIAGLLCLHRRNRHRHDIAKAAETGSASSGFGRRAGADIRRLEQLCPTAHNERAKCIDNTIGTPP
jgi:hypothetical protein